MAPTIHGIRHAQGYHNLSVANHSMHDPLLTKYGEEQCSTLQKNFPDFRSIDLVVASPLKRTVYTALNTFEPIIREKGLQVICLPELQETSDLPCDTGSPPEELEREFAGKPVDLSRVKPGWDNKRMKWAPTATAIEKRAREARVWLKARPEKEIAVVTHGGFLHYITEDWSDDNHFHGTGWANTEYRTYTFSTYEPDEAHLAETFESRRRRLGDEKPLDQHETVQLQRTTTNERERVSKEVLEKQIEQAQKQAEGAKAIQAKV